MPTTSRPSAVIPLGRAATRSKSVLLALSEEQLDYIEPALEQLQAGPRGRSTALRELLLLGAEQVRLADEIIVGSKVRFLRGGDEQDGVVIAPHPRDPDTWCVGWAALNGSAANSDWFFVDDLAPRKSL